MQTLTIRFVHKVFFLFFYLTTGVGIFYSKLHFFYVCNSLTDLKRNFILNVNSAKKLLNKQCALSKKVHGRSNVNIKNKFNFIFTLKDEGGWFGPYFFLLVCPCCTLKGQRHKILESFLWPKIIYLCPIGTALQQMS